MVEQEPEKAGARAIPFNNLFLVSGMVHGQNRLSMYLITILLFIAGYTGYQLVAFMPLVGRLMAAGYSTDEIASSPGLLFDSAALGLDTNLLLAIELGMFVFAFLGLWVGIRFIHGKPLVSVLTGYERFRFGRFWFSFLVWGILIATFVLAAWFSGSQELQLVFEPEGFMLSLLLMALLLPVQVAFEEVIFRGYLMQGLALAFRNGIAPLVITTLLFGLAHLGNPEVQKHGWEIMLPFYCLNALFMGVITLLDEGLELAYGMHLANNFVSGLMITTPNSVIKPYTIFLAPSEHPEAEIVGWLVMATVMFMIFRFRYKWKNYRLLLK